MKSIFRKDWDTAQTESILTIPLACDLNFLIKELPVLKKMQCFFFVCVCVFCYF